MKDAVGESISHYRVLEELGRGGMGVVYKALDTVLNRHVAIKFLNRSEEASPEAAERLRREAQAASCLNHPNICTVHEIGEWEGDTFIVMEYVEGVPLSGIIDREMSVRSGNGQTDVTRALRLALQIAEGLQKAHEKKLVHRDIKPDNIMVTQDGLVKIMDFGLAKIVGAERLTKTFATLGTVSYMSPEQARGLPVDHRADIFSFGALLYEMLAGQVPFRGEHQAAVLYEVVNVDPPPLIEICEGVDVELNRIVLKCLAKEPAERYQSARDLLVDLRAYEPEAAGKEILHPESSIERGERFRKLTSMTSAGDGGNKRGIVGRRWIVYIAGGGAILLLGMVVVLLLWRPWKVIDTAQVSIYSQPPGVQIELNRKVVGTTPVEGQITNAGAFEIRATKDGYQPFDTLMALLGGESGAITIHLLPAIQEESQAIGEPEESRAPPRSEGVQKDATFLTVEELADHLSLALTRVSEPVRGKVVLQPFTYRGTKIPSLFSQVLKLRLEQSLVGLAAWRVADQVDVSLGGRQKQKAGAIKGDVYAVLSGFFWENGDVITCAAQLRRSGSMDFLSSATGNVRASALVRQGISVTPDNFSQTLKDQATLNVSPVSGGDLRVDLWTNKGKENLLFEENDTMEVFLRVNRPCNVRLVYLQADSQKVLLVPDQRFTESMVNRDIKMKRVLCGPPFGAELIHAFASTEPLPAIRTIKRKDGLLVIADELQAVAGKTRGIREAVPGSVKAEAQIVLTTVVRMRR